MKLFEEERKPQDAAALVLALFREFEETEGGVASKAISPSGLSCPVACAFKLGGAPTAPYKESFQSRGFAEAGEDRHKRIQGFLSKTEYWVDVAQYIKDKKLPLEVVVKEEFETLLWSEEYKCRFKCDGILKIDGEYYVLEIKTERQQANTYRIGPDEKHRDQGTAYAMLFETRGILWVYEGRDFMEQKAFVQVISKEERTAMSNYIKKIIANVDTPTLLERNLKACGYCAYGNYCKMLFKQLEKEKKNAK